jgi:hypothetical protein
MTWDTSCDPPEDEKVVRHLKLRGRLKSRFTLCVRTVAQMLLTSRVWSVNGSKRDPDQRNRRVADQKRDPSIYFHVFCLFLHPLLPVKDGIEQKGSIQLE